MKGCKIVQNRVKELRKERNILQEELAAKLNVSQQTICTCQELTHKFFKKF